MSKKEEVVIFWFRRDLRLEDNVGLFHALSSGFRVLPLFIFDTKILEQFPNQYDRRIDYIYQALENINAKLIQYESSVLCLHSNVEEAFTSVFSTYIVRAVYANEDYEPQSIIRDQAISELSKKHGILFHLYKDHVIFRGGELLKADGTPYQIYTPYAKLWRSKLTEQVLFNYTKPFHRGVFVSPNSSLKDLDQLGYIVKQNHFRKPTLDSKIINNYDKYRDFPAVEGTTHLGIALRFGTISIRKCVCFALQHNEVWLKELIWRDFFSQIMYLYPHVVNRCFKVKYEKIKWRNNEDEFQLWCEGNTGYPLVDAGMRELNETGFMHNRVRMVVASFLTKHLLIDWRWGEAYFAQHLLDYDLASNNGNWQWAAGSGCDAAPYFRIFNPLEQQRKFDADGVYIKKWVKELGSLTYPVPIVEHKEARLRAIAIYKEALVK